MLGPWRAIASPRGGQAYGFSRDQEAQADRIGLQLMQQAGYDGREFPRVWDNLLAELKVTGGDEAAQRSILFATHPAPGNRRDTLRQMAGEGGGRLGTEELERVVAPHRMEWLREEIRRGQYEESLELFNRASSRCAPTMRSSSTLAARCTGCATGPRTCSPRWTTSSAAAERPPPDLFRSLGLLQKRRGDKAAAAAAFQKYLALVPDAGDAGLIKTYQRAQSRRNPCHPPGRAGRRLCLRRQGRGRAGAQQPHERAAALGMEPHRREPAAL